MVNTTISQARKLLLSKDISVKELTSYYLDRISNLNSKLNAYLLINEKAIDEAEKLDNNFSQAQDSKLFGIPLSIKDAFNTRGMITTAASNILKNFNPPYESTVTSKLSNAKSIFLGKTNLDAFCHGSSTVTSDFGPTRNPWDISKLPGGSSGGSAAAVSADMCLASVGTETAGSLRQPSSWCGVVGLKPTYGRVSRYGVIAMGSSLDSPGPIARSVEDTAILLSVIAGYDPHDFTSAKNDVPDYSLAISKDIKGMKIGVPKQFIELDIPKEILSLFNESIEKLKSLGAEIKYLDILDLAYSEATYTILCRSEVSSNLSRYDGTRYSPNGEMSEYVSEYFESTRGKGFGKEAKRRVMTGTYSLSAGYSDKYYKKAELVRAKIKEDMLKALLDVDVLVGPTTPSTALTDADALVNPLFGEMSDIYAEGSTLSGLPAINVPMGLINGLPIGIQFIGRHFEEQTIINTGYAFESLGTMLIPKI